MCLGNEDCIISIFNVCKGMGVGECPRGIGKDFLKEGAQISCKSRENNDKKVRAKRAALTYATGQRKRWRVAGGVCDKEPTVLVES